MRLECGKSLGKHAISATLGFVGLEKLCVSVCVYVHIMEESEEN